MNHVFKWISYILVEVKSFSDGVAEIILEKAMDLRQMMMIHQHFRGFCWPCFPALMIWGIFQPWKSRIWMIHLMAWFWKRALDTMTWWSGKHDCYSSMVPQMVFLMFFLQTRQHCPENHLWIIYSFCGLNFNDLEGIFKFAAWSFSITAQNSSLKADCGWKLWFPRLPGLYFVHTKTKTAKSTRRPSKTQEKTRPGHPELQPKCLLGAGAWRVLGFRQWNWHVFVVEKAIWMFPKDWGYPQIIHFNRVFHYFHHPFWDIPIFWKHPILWSDGENMDLHHFYSILCI